jgi:hypothetical protein
MFLFSLQLLFRTFLAAIYLTSEMCVETHADPTGKWSLKLSIEMKTGMVYHVFRKIFQYKIK